jgi:hypothetical protein
MKSVTKANSRELSPELKGRLEERVQKQAGVLKEAETIFKHRRAARDAVLDLIEARWSKLPTPPSAQEVESWIAQGRRGGK